jgi:inner membrane protein
VGGVSTSGRQVPKEKPIPSALSHPAPALALSTLFRSPRLPARVLIAGAACSIVPDFDVLTFRFGVPYESMLGHRGITHSIPFAIGFGAVVALVLAPGVPGVPRSMLWLYLSAATASHGFFDALTDGGRGVAFFAPFSDSRYFFPARPIEVSPLSVKQFLSARGAQILRSELEWVWLPSLGVALALLALRRARSG